MHYISSKTSFHQPILPATSQKQLLKNNTLTRYYDIFLCRKCTIYFNIMKQVNVNSDLNYTYLYVLQECYVNKRKKLNKIMKNILQNIFPPNIINSKWPPITVFVHKTRCKVSLLQIVKQKTLL